MDENYDHLKTWRTSRLVTDYMNRYAVLTAKSEEPQKVLEEDTLLKKIAEALREKPLPERMGQLSTIRDFAEVHKPYRKTDCDSIIRLYIERVLSLEVD